jgi:DNA-binding GntR family transcriptional regulator
MAHTAIFNAIQSRDVDTATKVLKDHILIIHKNALNGIQERLLDMEGILF